MEEKYCEIEERRIPIRMEDRQGRAASQATRESEVLQKFADRVVPATAEEIDLWLRMHPAAASLIAPIDPAEDDTNAR